MTEDQWFASNDPNAMLDFLAGTDLLSNRKAKLFAVAICRRIWHLLPDDRSRKAVDVAERYADGEASRKELATVQAAIRGIRSDTARMAAGTAAASAARHAAGVQRYYSTANAAADACWAAARATVGIQPTGESGYSAVWAAAKAEGRVQAALLREILGPVPFHPLPALSRSVLCWEGGCVGRLAASLYHDRDFSPERMGVLADALEEAGVGDEEVLGHLRRAEAIHVRGCWLVDLLTGRE